MKLLLKSSQPHAGAGATAGASAGAIASTTTASAVSSGALLVVATAVGSVSTNGAPGSGVDVVIISLCSLKTVTS